MKTTQKVLDKARQRANGRCEKCGKNPDWRGLQVHHRKLKGMGGSGDPKVHAIENLIVLCGHCHSLAHGIIER